MGKAISFYSNIEFWEKLKKNFSDETTDSFLEPILVYNKENLDFFKMDKKVPLFLHSGGKQVYVW